MHTAPACNEALILKPLIKFLYHRLQTPPQPPFFCVFTLYINWSDIKKWFLIKHFYQQCYIFQIS